MRHLYLIVTAAIALWANVAVGQVQPAEVNPKKTWLDDFAPKNWSFSSNYRSGYLFYNGLMVYDGGVIQNDLFITTNCGLTLDIWSSIPTSFGQIGDNFATEVDFTVGWVTKIDDYTLSAGVAYYDLKKVLSVEGTDFISPYIEISRKFELTKWLTLNPFIRGDINFTPDKEIGGDTLIQVGTRYGLKLGDTISLAGKIQLVYDPGILGGDVAWVGYVDGGLLWKIGNNIVIEAPYVKMTSPLNDVTDDRKTESVFGGGITFKF